jgi:hypothetical protein
MAPVLTSPAIARPSSMPDMVERRRVNRSGYFGRKRLKSDLRLRARVIVLACDYDEGIELGRRAGCYIYFFFSPLPLLPPPKQMHAFCTLRYLPRVPLSHHVVALSEEETTRKTLST